MLVVVILVMVVILIVVVLVMVVLLVVVVVVTKWIACKGKSKSLFCTACTRYNNWLLYNQAHNNIALKTMTNKISTVNLSHIIIGKTDVDT